MAHAYTTKRGKNKMSKLGVRKDQQQNSERSLKQNPLANLLYEGPKENNYGILGSIGTSSARLEDARARLQRAIADKCSNPNCSSASSTSTLSDCASCRQARYCSRDCQLAHWDAHKARCKEIRKELKERERQVQENVTAALQDLGIATPGAEAAAATSTEAPGAEQSDANEPLEAATEVGVEAASS